MERRSAKDAKARRFFLRLGACVGLEADGVEMFGLHQDEIDRRHIHAAIELARKALDSEDVPIGALVEFKGRIIGRGFNQRELLGDPTAHAEMIALTAAAERIGHWRLEGCTMYVTL